MTVTLKKQSIVDQWGTVVEHGAGREKWVLDTTERLIQESKMPGISVKQDQVTMGMFSAKRNFVIVGNAGAKEFYMFIGARDFGMHLDAAWYLTLFASGLKSAMSRRMTGSPNALSMNINMFTQQDLRAYVTVANHCFRQALDELYQELKITPKGLDTRSTGFLSVW
jgi:hypothetical protein